MSQQTISGGGAFTKKNIDDVNANFSELYAGGSGQTLASPTITGTVAGGATYTAPTFTTPALGTPASGVLTNATGLPISTGLTGAGTGVLAALAVNVGSAGAPVVLNGALGTPATGTLTNCTGLPIAGLTGLGTGIATGLAANGVTAGPFTTVASINVVGGIVTTLTGS